MTDLSSHLAVRTCLVLRLRTLQCPPPTHTVSHTKEGPAGTRAATAPRGVTPSPPSTFAPEIPLTRCVGAVAAKFDRIGGVVGSVIAEPDVFYHPFDWETNYCLIIGKCVAACCLGHARGGGGGGNVGGGGGGGGGRRGAVLGLLFKPK